MTEKSHQHGNNNMSTLRFAFVTALNAIVTIAELVGGLLSGSLSLISDAFHNLQDTLSIVFSFITHLIAKKESDEQRTFGYQRAEILGAFLNAVLLVAVTIFLVIESIKRLGHLEPINSNLMLWVAVIGLLSNIASMLLMMRDSKNSLNIRATFLHMASDTLSSIGVIVAALLIKWFGFEWADPVITVITALWIMKESFGVIKQTVSILMESSPSIDLHAVCNSIIELEQIRSIHHVHIWRIDENLISLDAHINISENLQVSDLDKLYQQINQLLADKYGIGHVTLQAEYERGLQAELVAADHENYIE